MKITVVEAKPEHYNEILELIQKYLDTEGGWERNKYLFSYQWTSMPDFNQTTPGKVLLADNRVVGYIGYIVSKRNYVGEEVICINGSNLVVHPNYSMHMLKLFEPYLRKDAIRTAYNPRKNVEKLYTNKFFEFKSFDNTARIFPRVLAPKNCNIEVCDKIETALLCADKKEKLLIEDNCKYIAETITIITDEGKFNIIGRKFRLRLGNSINFMPTFFEVLYIGNRELFGRYIGQIINPICKSKKSHFFVCGNRFIEAKKLPFNINKEFKCFCSSVKGVFVDSKEIDDLYSEKTILNFYDPPKPINITLKKLIRKKDLLAIED